MKLYRFWDESKSSAKFLTPVIKGRISEGDAGRSLASQKKSIKAIKTDAEE